MKKLYISMLSLSLLSCAAPRQTPAPIENAGINAPKPIVSTPGPAKPVEVVENAPVETQINKLDSTPAKVVENNVDNPPSETSKTSSSQKLVNIGSLDWLAPVSEAKIIKPYSAASKGVDLGSVSIGSAIVASADGVVAYSGKGPSGYGLLVIIKHKDNYLTAYSHNKVNLVKKDDIVKRGQKIAEVGMSDAAEPMLHYELRQHGKPLNPTKIFQ